VSLNRLSQNWDKSNLTCVRLETEFVYLAVVVDAFSRRAIGRQGMTIAVFGSPLCMRRGDVIEPCVSPGKAPA
jgi:hypothetical protein